MEWRTAQIPESRNVYVPRAAGDAGGQGIECRICLGNDPLIHGDSRLEPDRSRALEGGHSGESPPSFRPVAG